MTDHRDITIEMLADAEAALIEHNASVEADVAIARELISVLMDVLHDLTVDQDRRRAAHEQLLDAYRALREHVLFAAGVDDAHEAI